MDTAPIDATPGTLAEARVAELRAIADGDDAALVQMCAAELARLTAYTSRVEALRDAAVGRLREQGMPMTRISLLARVSDSYLSRRQRRATR